MWIQGEIGAALSRMRYGVSRGLWNVGGQEAWGSMYFVPG